MSQRLPLEFYMRDTEEVARDLLGHTLVHVVGGKRLAGRIVETEAYIGAQDPACHGFGERRTERTESLFLPGGHAYVYFIYGMHYCFNVVTRDTSRPEAVLIRALEPLEGIDEMRRFRALKAGAKSSPQTERKNLIALTSGPAKLCQALHIDRACDRLLLTKEPLFIERGDEVVRSRFEIEASPRIGVDYAGEAALWPLRFSLRGNPFVSRPPKSSKARGK